MRAQSDQLVSRIPPSTRLHHRLARSLLIPAATRIAHGQLELRDAWGTQVFGAPTPELPKPVVVTVHDASFYSRVLLEGSLGAGRAFIEGAWSANDLVAAVRILVRNSAALERLDFGWGRVAQPIHALAHRLRRNTRAGSRTNIADHYDLGNDLYAAFLDETMTYSCGIFERRDSTLREASVAKLERLCRKLDLRSSDHLLEIGSGWGSMAIHAASQYGCRVTTATISREQYDYTRESVAREGLNDRVEVLLEDYRDLKGHYDKLVSVEMVEAVGAEYFESFFRLCSDRLHPNGRMALQAITIREQLHDRHVKHADFIKRFIFPGGTLLSVAAMSRAVAQASDFALVHLEELTPHYARTLRAWHERFVQNLERVRALGYDEAFIRMWRFYLALCEGAFEERYIGTVQVVLSKPNDRPELSLPPLTREENAWSARTPSGQNMEKAA